MDSNLKKELKQFQKRKSRAEDKGDLEEEAKVCSFAGDLLMQNGFYGEAVIEYKQALQVYDARLDTINSAISHRMVGECLCALGKYKDALFHQNLHLKLAKETNNLVEEQRACATIGRTWFVYSDSALDSTETEECLMEAQKAYLESLSVCDDLQGTVSDTELLEMRSRLYLNLGLVYDSKNDNSSSMMFMEKALVIAREQNLLETEFRCHYCIGGVLTKLGQDAQSHSAFKKAVQVARKNNKKFDEADALVQLGQVYLKLGECLLARRTLKQAYKISQSRSSEMEGLKPSLVAAIKGLKLIDKLNDKFSEGNDKVKLLDALGDLYSEVKAFQKALDCYNKELDVAKSIGLSPGKLSPIYVSLAMTYSDLGQPQKAIQCYMDELATIDGNYRAMCDTWCNVAQVHEINNESYEDIEMAYQYALKYAEKANKVSVQIRVYKCLVDIQQKYEKINLCSGTRKKIENLESEFGIEEESDEETIKKSDDDDDDDVIIEREMLQPDTDEDEDNEDSDNETSVVRRRNRSTRLSKVNEKGETPLHRAAIAGDADLVEKIINQGADINARDYCGWQPLHEACNHGNTDVVRVLIAKGACVNDPGGVHCQGVTPLHDAAQNGHLDIVRLLVEHGASLVNKDVKGNTPLNAVISAQRSEEDSDLFGCETREVAGRKDVEKYLKRFSLADKNKNKNNSSIKQPEMRRRNLLFLDDGNGDDGDDDDDEDDDVEVPSLSRFAERLEKRGQQRGKKWSTLSSDSDEDDEQHRENLKARTSKAPGRARSAMDLATSEVANTLRRKDDEDLDESPCDEEGRMSEEYQDEASLSPVGSSHSDQTHEASESRRQESQIDKSLCLQSRLPQTQHFIDTITGKRTIDNEKDGPNPALISERDLVTTTVTSVIDESDWLIDDMPERPLKRRRTAEKQTTLGRSLELSRRRPTTFGSKHTRNSSGNSASKRLSRPKQARLEARSTPSPAFVSTAHQSTPGYHSNDHVQSSQSHVTDLSFTESSTGRHGNAPPMRVLVQVQGKTFLIPCPEKDHEDLKTIAWLAEQAKLRYFTAYGLRPVLALQTNEGAFLSPDDKISEVLSNNEQIVASLESWDLPPLAERYTACLSNNCNVKKDILAVLQAEPQASVISLGNLALKADHVQPLARALQCHERLIKLILPGNRIGDSGVHHISASLSTLPNLAVLDLQSNGISHRGVAHLANALTANNDAQEINSVPKLEDLNLSCNALGDTCGTSLANILLACPQLNYLHVESCSLTGRVLEPGKPLALALAASRLRHLSLAHNAVGAQGVADMLSALPRHVMGHLDLSSTGLDKSSVGIAMEGIVSYMDKEDCALQTLVLADCSLTGRELESLTGTRCFKSGLRSLDISCNNIGIDAQDAIKRLVSESQTLTDLCLRGNHGICTDSFHAMLASHCTNSSRLQHIDLSSCNVTSPITADILRLIGQICKGTLLELDLSFCQSLTDADRLSIADAWRNSPCDGERVAIIQGSYCILGTTQTN